MQQAEAVLLTAIRNALFQTKENYPADPDWDAVLREAEQQAVVGVAFCGVPESVQLRWKAANGQVVSGYMRVLYAQRKLIDLMSAHHIPMTILKGAAAAVYYPVPSARMQGDIDFLVPQDRFAEAKQLMQENGYRPFVHYVENPRHTGYGKDGVSFELHHHFSHEDIDFEEVLIDGLAHVQVGRIDGQEFPMLPKLANGLVLLDHMRNHLKNGLGLRQALDWMLYVYRELDDAFWNETFGPMAERYGMLPLAKVATRMCQRHLGLPESIAWCRDADDAASDLLLECLLSSGNFGRKNGAGGTIESVASSFRREGVFHYLQRAGEYNWKAYHRHPWLKPFCWLYQIFRYSKKTVRTKRGMRIADDLRRSRKRAKLLKQLGI